MADGQQPTPSEHKDKEMYGIYSNLSNFDEIEFTIGQLEDQIECALVRPSKDNLYRVAAFGEKLLELIKTRKQEHISPYQMRWKIIKGGRATVSRELRELEDIEEIISRKDLREGADFEIVKKLLPWGGYKKLCGITLNNEDGKGIENDGPITPEEMWALQNGY